MTTPQEERAASWDRLVAARKAYNDAQAELNKAVEEARERQDSWSTIGTALGMTKQGAWKRFGT